MGFPVLAGSFSILSRMQSRVLLAFALQLTASYALTSAGRDVGVRQNDVGYSWLQSDSIGPFESSQERLSSLRAQGVPDTLYDANHGVKMGIPFRDCDDGHLNITNDWDGRVSDYRCYGRKTLPANENVFTEQLCRTTPSRMSGHWCMFHRIFYDEAIPTFGDHRPLWPKYGEYTYLPRERFLHSLEHGAVAFFYHPCAKPWLVDKIRQILVGCMRRYIIAANKNVRRDKPLLLVAWGCKQHMASVDENEVVKFIRKRAMVAPESRTVRQGYYEFGLISESVEPPPGSDMNEVNLCPQYDPSIV